MRPTLPASDFDALPKIFSLADWCRLRGLSLRTADRLHKAGRLKITRLSQRKRVVTAEADRAFLASCESNTAA